MRRGCRAGPAQELGKIAQVQPPAHRLLVLLEIGATCLQKLLDGAFILRQITQSLRVLQGKLQRRNGSGATGWDQIGTISERLLQRFFVPPAADLFVIDIRVSSRTKFSRNILNVGCTGCFSLTARY